MRLEITFVAFLCLLLEVDILHKPEMVEHILLVLCITSPLE
jgi:hypothetical protein